MDTQSINYTMLKNFNAIKNNELLTCAILYGLTFAIALLLISFYFSPMSPESLDIDEMYYYSQAKNIVDGNYTVDSYRPNVFPMILAGALFFTHSNLFAANVLLILISSLRTPLFYILIQRILGIRTVSLVSSLLFALWPPLMYYSASFYSESLSLPFFLAFLIVLPNQENGRRLPWIIAGLFLGITIMIHPMYLLFLPFVVLIVFLEQRKFSLLLPRLALLFCTTFILIAPWSIAITLHEKSFFLLSSNSADALAGGLNEKLIKEGYHIVKTPNGRKTWEGPGMWTWQHGYLTEEESKLPPKLRNPILFDRVFQWVKTHPYETLYLEFAKLMNMWGFYPFSLELPMRVVLGNIPILMVFFLGLAALWKWRPYYRELCRLWTLPVFVSGVALISWGSWRFRLPADAAFIALSTLFVHSLLTHHDFLPSSKRRKGWT